MKKVLGLVLVLLGTVTFASAQGFQASLFYFGPPLTMMCSGGNVLNSNDMVKIYWDHDDNGADDNDPQPPVGNSFGEVNMNQFPMGDDGYFNTVPDFYSISTVPIPNRYFLRICLEGTEKWESDTFSVIAGFQEVLFGEGFEEIPCLSVPCPGCLHPVPPSDLDASDNLFCDYVLITWQSDEPLADIFQIRRNDEVIAEVINNGPDSWLYTDECTPGQVYQYRIRAGHQCEDGSYVYSNWDATPPNNGSRGNNAGTGEITLISSGQGLWNYELAILEGCVSRFRLCGIADGTTAEAPDGWIVSVIGDSVVFFTNDPVGDGAVVEISLINPTAEEGIIGCEINSDLLGPAFISASPENHTLIPAEYSLSIYPNPFNPTTTIEFGLPVSGDVTIMIFDIQGRLVNTRFGFFSAGLHTFAFDATNLSTGVYFAHVVRGNYVMTKKLMVLK